MALSLVELIQNYNAGTLTDADVEGSDYTMEDVIQGATANQDEDENWAAETSLKIAFSGIDPDETMLFSLGGSLPRYIYFMDINVDDKVLCDLERKEDGYYGYIQYDRVEKAPRQNYSLSFNKFYLWGCKPLDVSTLEFTGVASSGCITFPKTKFRSMRVQEEISFETKDLATSFQRDIADGTAVKFKLGIDSWDKPCAIDIRPA